MKKYLLFSFNIAYGNHTLKGYSNDLQELRTIAKEEYVTKLNNKWKNEYVFFEREMEHPLSVNMGKIVYRYENNVPSYHGAAVEEIAYIVEVEKNV